MIRLVFLWHMHQPFYKDLVSGQYRLPWVRLHALKDYYGMVKLLDEFPDIHQTFNLVPSLITQIRDYAAGSASDPFLDVVAKPAEELSPDERAFALQYLFQANVTNLIGRYPRFRELHEKFVAYGSQPVLAVRQFTTQELTDLQVLSQLAWFDEFFLEEAEIAALAKKQRNYSNGERAFVVAKERELIARVLPAYADAAKRGGIEISTSPFYHPILPLLCDTDVGAVSHPGLPLPSSRFQHADDAREQLRRGLDLHTEIFASRPAGVWPSEGSVSEAVLRIGHELGVHWMATDEGVLGRSLGAYFARDGHGILAPEAAENLYRVYRYEKDGAEMSLLFRDHSLSDLIGFVYSAMPAREAAEHFVRRVKDCALPMLEKLGSATVPVILDGENAWEFFPQSGREFLRTLYRLISDDPQLEAVTVSEAIAHEQHFGELRNLVPGSWINSNFNVWIGAPEDNRAWDYLHAARELYARKAGNVTEEKRNLAFEELLIAEGSDWNWWYGPEHSTANDREFDELYRKHLSNVYHALDEAPPDHLAQPILRVARGAAFTEQTAFIRPQLDGSNLGYFDWIGAAQYRADVHESAMHGRRFLLEAAHVGIDADHLYCRVDFGSDLFTEDEHGGEQLTGDFEIVQSVECVGADGSAKEPRVRLVVTVRAGQRRDWRIEPSTDTNGIAHDAAVCLNKVLETKLALDHVRARIGDTLKIRFSIWENRLPVDSLPQSGEIKIAIRSAEQLSALATGAHWKV